MIAILVGLLLIVASSWVKVFRVARSGRVPARFRYGAVSAWVFGTLAIAVLPAFAALSILNVATGFVTFKDGGVDSLGAALLWVGICDLANIGRLVSPPAGERGEAHDLTRDRRLLFLAAMLATAAYAVALLISVGFVDGAHVGIGVAIVLSFLAAAATVRGRPGGPGLGPLSRRPTDDTTSKSGGLAGVPDGLPPVDPPAGPDDAPAPPTRDRDPDGDRSAR